MLCLRCGTDNPLSALRCSACDWHLGYAADGQGFLPQLHELDKGLAEGAIPPEVGTECLQRLNQALQAMILYVDEIGARLASMQLEEAQQGTLAGFMSPLRQTLSKLREAAAELDTAGNWSPGAWEEIETAQLAALRGNEGLAFLAQHLHGLLLEKMAADPELRAQIEAQAAAEREQAEMAREQAEMAAAEGEG